jgi:hypothetical protein
MTIHKLLDQMIDGCIEVSCTNSFPYTSGLEIFHKGEETRLWSLVCHGFAFYVADLLHGEFLFFLGEAVDVVEDVCWFFDSESGSVRLVLVGIVGSI